MKKIFLTQEGQKHKNISFITKLFGKILIFSVATTCTSVFAHMTWVICDSLKMNRIMHCNLVIYHMKNNRHVNATRSTVGVIQTIDVYHCVSSLRTSTVNIIMLKFYRIVLIN